MRHRVHLVACGPWRGAALYALRVLVEPLGFEEVEGTGGDSEALRGEGAVLLSYGATPPDIPARAHLHVTAHEAFWASFLKPQSLPRRPFHRLEAADLALGRDLAEPLVVPFVTDSPTQFDLGPSRRIVVGADIVASAFFFLTRYEEALATERDRWGRVPEERLSLVEEGLADRAPVDEYREVLAAWLSRLLNRPVAAHPPGYEVLLTHDVDSGFRVRRGPFWSHVLRGMARDLLRHGAPRTALELGVNALAAAAGRPIPFGGIRDILRLAERHGRTSHFFFMANGTHPDDAAYDLRDQAVRKAIRTLVEAGHRVGLHVGLHAAGDATALRREWDLLAEVLQEAPCGTRTHFLAFDPAVTPRLLAEAGARLDSSAGFSARCGFRTGTTRPHRLFDFEARRPLDLIEYPLAVMDKAVYDQPPAQRRALVQRTVDTVRRHGGCLTLNWHYWYFTHRYRSLCEEVLAACRGGRDAVISAPPPPARRVHDGGSVCPS